MSKDSHRRLKIMIVDDDLITLEVLRERLAEAGHDVSVRSSPVGTAADILAQRIELIVLDIMMPGLRGDDLARMLKRHPATSNVGIILHSSLSKEQLRPLIMTTGALGVIEKTSSTQVFLFAFNCLVARLSARARRADEAHAPRSSRSDEQAPAPSGTYRVGQGQAPTSNRTPEAAPRAGVPKRRQ